ncbi:hypothetical protein PVL29_019459 [Vitis rotundifolia]|uniref:Glutathione S-transferase n=1 Tax=Vitis rotundifolia TaxID=103349 RepID=A0AA39DDL6_VITRO|nr:hypothetical protein PVL29_019459 [Vitis rotundifolia]
MWIQVIRYTRKGFTVQHLYSTHERSCSLIFICFLMYGMTSIRSVFITQGKELEEAMEHLKFLEEKLKGKMSFGGEMIMFLDLALGWLANLISILEEIVGLKVGDEEKFPLLSPWTRDFADAPTIKGNWPH